MGNWVRDVIEPRWGSEKKKEVLGQCLGEEHRTVLSGQERRGGGGGWNSCTNPVVWGLGGRWGGTFGRMGFKLLSDEKVGGRGGKSALRSKEGGRNLRQVIFRKKSENRCSYQG